MLRRSLIAKSAEKHPRRIEAIPCKIKNTPTIAAMAIMLASGFKNIKPTTASTTPSAVNQPHPRTPSRCRSKELTNLVMPEKSSHMPKINGSVNAVNH